MNYRALKIVVWLILVFAALQIGRAAVSQNSPFIDPHQYAHLAGKSPYQNRIAMAPVLLAAEHSKEFATFHRVFFGKTVDDPLELASMLVDSLCLVLLLPITAALRRSFTPQPAISWLAPALMLLVVAFTYVVRYEQRFSYPYDFPSMLLFNLGLLAILARRGWLLTLLLAVAIPNRETAVFLVPVWFWLQWRERRYISAVAYSALGVVIAAAWYVEIKSILHSPDVPYLFPFVYNLYVTLLPAHWPQLLSVFGFLAIPMWLLRSYLTDPRLKAAWLSAVPFILAALIVGVWRETRIFGELSSLVAVTFAIQLEQLIRVTAAGSPQAAA